MKTPQLPNRHVLPNTGSTIFIPTPGVTELPLREWFETGTRVEVDIGCGKGRFLLARAATAAASGFLGIDLKLDRLKKIERKIHRAGLTNIRLVRAEAAYALSFMLPASAVSVYYVFFPDPWPKRRHHARRLFSPAFLDALHTTLCPAGCIHAATDHEHYFNQIRNLFKADTRFEEIPAYSPTEAERSDFEVEFMLEQRAFARCSYRKRVQ